MRTALKFGRAYGASFQQLFAKIKMTGSRHIISGTASERFFKEIVFSDTSLTAIGWDGDIMHDLGRKMTTNDL